MGLRFVAPKGEVCINRRFAYTAKQRPLKAGRAKTEEYIDIAGRADSRFCAKGCQRGRGD